MSFRALPFRDHALSVAESTVTFPGGGTRTMAKNEAFTVSPSTARFVVPREAHELAHNPVAYQFLTAERAEASLLNCFELRISDGREVRD